MAPQRHGNGPPPWLTEGDEDPSTPSTTLYELPVESSVDFDVGAPVLIIVESPYYPPGPSVTTMSPYPPGPTARPTIFPTHFAQEWPNGWSAITTTSTTSSEFWESPPTSTSSSLSSTSTAIAGTTQPATTSTNGFPGGWRNRIKEEHNQAPLYAAAAVVPVAVLAIIGVIVFICLRKRKRRKSKAVAASVQAQEMKEQWKPTAQPYMAPSHPPPAVLPSYSPPVNYPASESLVSSRPIILGPIPSGTNGAYLTGIDTSDMVSVTSARDPFADGRSLEEPPPPYRPRSLAPSSIAPTSRHSSVRVAALPPASSQIHLIERSPFDDPEDDNISELSIPTNTRGTDALSIVSDLSYQNDPVVGRSSL